MEAELASEIRDCPMCGQPSSFALTICRSCGERLISLPGDLPDRDQFTRSLNSVVWLWLGTGGICFLFGLASYRGAGHLQDLEWLLSLLPMAWGLAFLFASWGTARRSAVAIWIAIALSIPVFVLTILSVVLLPLGLVLFFGMLRAHLLADWLRLARQAGIRL